MIVITTCVFLPFQLRFILTHVLLKEGQYTYIYMDGYIIHGMYCLDTRRFKHKIWQFVKADSHETSCRDGTLGTSEAYRSHIFI